MKAILAAILALFLIGATQHPVGTEVEYVLRDDVISAPADTHGILVQEDGVLIENVVVNGGRHGIVLKDCKHVTLRHVTIIGASHSGIAVYNCDDVLIENARIVRPGLSGVSAFLDTKRLTVRDTVVEYPGQDGFTGYGNRANGFRVFNGTVIEPGGHGAHLGGRDSLIDGLRVSTTRGRGSSGVYIGTNNDPDEPAYGAVLNNIFVDGPFRHGIWAHNVHNLVIGQHRVNGVRNKPVKVS